MINFVFTFKNSHFLLSEVVNLLLNIETIIFYKTFLFSRVHIIWKTLIFIFL